MFLLSDIPQNNQNLFDYVSISYETKVKSNTTEILDYMLTIYPRNENTRTFNFVHGIFDKSYVAFAENQSDIIDIAGKLFSNSESLQKFESDILNKTFNRLIKSSPTLSGRK